ASNLVVAPGKLSERELLAAAGEGVYVTDVAGLHSGVKPVTGVFSVGASGRTIRGGELAEPVREFTIAGELLEMLANVREAGAEPLGRNKTAVDGVEAGLDAGTGGLSAGAAVSFTGFGQFHGAESGPREGVNPRTGERITIPGGKVPRFSAGSALKTKVKGG